MEDLQSNSENVLKGDLGAIFGIDLTASTPADISDMKAKAKAKNAKITSDSEAKRLSDAQLKEAIEQIGQSRIQKQAEVPLKTSVQTKGRKKKISETEIFTPAPAKPIQKASSKISSPKISSDYLQKIESTKTSIADKAKTKKTVAKVEKTKDGQQSKKPPMNAAIPVATVENKNCRPKKQTTKHPLNQDLNNDLKEPINATIKDIAKDKPKKRPTITISFKS
jgi:hypothetical protein